MITAYNDLHAPVVSTPEATVVLPCLITDDTIEATVEDLYGDMRMCSRNVRRGDHETDQEYTKG